MVKTKVKSTPTSFADFTASDISKMGGEMGMEEVKVFVQLYRQRQIDRLAHESQLRELNKIGKDSTALRVLAAQAYECEQVIKIAMDEWTTTHVLGAWMRRIYMVGPVIAAGILSELDITKAKTAGAFMRFGGIDPTAKWEKGQRRPFNAKLKQYLYYAGDVFNKARNNEKCFYGNKIILPYIKHYSEQNEAGAYIETAKQLVATCSKNTQAYKAGLKGMLSDYHIKKRAIYKGKQIFVSHLFDEWYRLHYNQEPPAPYVIAHMGHIHPTIPSLPKFIPPEERLTFDDNIREIYLESLQERLANNETDEVLETDEITHNAEAYRSAQQALFTKYSIPE